MRAFVERPRTRFVTAAIATIIAALLLACGEVTGPTPSRGGADSLQVAAVSLRAVSVRWAGVPTEGGVAPYSYRVERRAGLAGPFSAIGPMSDATRYFDTDVEPDSYYGYRIVAVSPLGVALSPSVVRGAKTPPWPGITVAVSTTTPPQAPGDVDGYVLRLRGMSDTIVRQIGTQGKHAFTPLEPGSYTVELGGVSPTCTVGDSVRNAVIVPSEGLQTVAEVTFGVTCLDPARGRVVVVAATEGDSVAGVTLIARLTGIIADTAVTATRPLGSTNSSVSFDNLQAGTYEIALETAAAQCVVAGGRVREVNVAAGDADTVRFALACNRPAGPPPDVGRYPYVLSNSWSAASAAPGSRVSLTLAFDLSARPAFDLAAAQAVLVYDSTALRYDGFTAVPGGLDGLTINGGRRGTIIWVVTSGTGAGRRGVVGLVRLEFTVTGAPGARATTSTRELGDFGNADLSMQYGDSVRVVEDTLAIVASTGGGGANQPPRAEANGPYAATARVPVALSAAGSSDPDGTIASYSWNLGAAGSATGATPDATFANAGTYTVTLTVTDDRGATATDQATVVVVAAGGGGTNQPPIARIAAPSALLAGAAGSFSAAASTDADGTITSYAWQFGDGGVATGSAATHAYAAAGTYVVTLVVTDDRGATASAQTTVTVAPAAAGGLPFTWAGSFGAINAADSIVELRINLDLSTDIAETPGAEQLESWVVDSLKWDPAVLRFVGFTFGPGRDQRSDQSFVMQGKLGFRGAQTGTTNSSGSIYIARIRFKVIGVRGGSTTTRTAVGPLIGAASTNGFNYRARTAIAEATLTVP